MTEPVGIRTVLSKAGFLDLARKNANYVEAKRARVLKIEASDDQLRLLLSYMRSCGIHGTVRTVSPEEEKSKVEESEEDGRANDEPDEVERVPAEESGRIGRSGDHESLPVEDTLPGMGGEDWYS